MSDYSVVGTNESKEYRLIGGSYSKRLGDIPVISGMTLRVASKEAGRKKGGVLAIGLAVEKVAGKWQFILPFGSGKGTKRLNDYHAKMVLNFINQHDGLPHLGGK